MDALRDIASLILQTFFQLAILAFILRIMLQLAKADFYNPVSQFLVKVTQPVLKPMRRFIPSIGNIDTASIVTIVILQMLATVALIVIKGYNIPNVLYLLSWAVLGSIGMLINIYLIAIIASIVISWVAPGSYNPAILLLNQLTEPVMAPFRKIIPPLGGLDLSPIFVFLAINVLQIILGHIAAAVQLPIHLVIGI